MVRLRMFFVYHEVNRTKTLFRVKECTTIYPVSVIRAVYLNVVEVCERRVIDLTKLTMIRGKHNGMRNDEVQRDPLSQGNTPERNWAMMRVGHGGKDPVRQ